MRMQSTSCFSFFPVSPVLMYASACWTASSEMWTAGCMPVASMEPSWIALTASGEPSKPMTRMSPVLPACCTAATAPTAMVSLPQMMAWTSASRWRSVSTFW